MSHTVEFISYDGGFPNLCSGTLVLRLDGIDVTFPSYSLSSGGGVRFDGDWMEHVDDGEWSISEWPDGWPEDAKGDAVDEVNSNVSHGCCGGCV